MMMTCDHQAQLRPACGTGLSRRKGLSLAGLRDKALSGPIGVQGAFSAMDMMHRFLGLSGWRMALQATKGTLADVLPPFPSFQSAARHCWIEVSSYPTCYVCGGSSSSQAPTVPQGRRFQPGKIQLMYEDTAACARWRVTRDAPGSISSQTISERLQRSVPCKRP